MIYFYSMTYTDLLNYCYHNGITLKMINKGTKSGIINTIISKKFNFKKGK